MEEQIMKKITLITIILFCFTCVAQAKISYNSAVLTDMHLNTIKGLLYDLAHPENAEEANEENIQQLLPKFSKTIVWLTNHHNSSRTYRLERMQNEESEIIKNMITTIADLMQGQYSGFPVERAMYRWTVMGSRVLAEYRIITDGLIPQIQWKLELKPEEAKIRNLVFRYEIEAEVTEINQQ